MLQMTFDPGNIGIDVEFAPLYRFYDSRQAIGQSDAKKGQFRDRRR